MTDENKPPVERRIPPVQTPAPPVQWQTPPAQAVTTRPIRYPQVFPAARWRLAAGIFGCVFFTPLAALLVWGGAKAFPILFVAAFLFLWVMVYGLLETRVQWTIYEDRLEYRTPLGRVQTVRRADFVSFKSDFTGGKWTLKGSHSKILVHWGAENWSVMRDILLTWMPRKL